MSEFDVGNDGEVQGIPLRRRRYIAGAAQNGEIALLAGDELRPAQWTRRVARVEHTARRDWVELQLRCIAHKVTVDIDDQVSGVGYVGAYGAVETSPHDRGIVFDASVMRIQKGDRRHGQSCRPNREVSEEAVRHDRDVKGICLCVRRNAATAERNREVAGAASGDRRPAE